MEKNRKINHYLKVEIAFWIFWEDYLPRKQEIRKLHKFADIPQTDIFILLKLNISKIKLV